MTGKPATNVVPSAPDWPGQDPQPERIVDPAHLRSLAGDGRRCRGPAWIAYQLVTNPGFQWDIVGRYLFDPIVLRGVVMTIQLTVLVAAIGVVVGVVVALMRLSRDPLLNFCAHGFVWFFRGTPVLVSSSSGTILPRCSPRSFRWAFRSAARSSRGVGDRRDLVLHRSAARSGLNEGAYMAEIIRAGLLDRRRRPRRRRHSGIGRGRPSALSFCRGGHEGDRAADRQTSSSAC